MQTKLIFDKDTRTKLEILTIIGDSSEWFSAERLSLKTTIDKKTILKYCRELDSHSQKFDGKLSITISKSKGISMKVDSRQTLADFKLFILENTMALKLMKRLFFNQSCSLALLEQELFISESTIRRKIRQFKAIIADYDISIVYKENSYVLVGDEAQIRMYALMAFWMTYKGAFWPFPMIDEEKMTKTVSRLLAHYGIEDNAINETDKRMLTYILSIHVIRYHQGNKIVWKSEWDVYKSTNSVFDFDDFLNDYLLSEEEKDFFYLLLQTFVKPFDFESISTPIIQAHKAENTPAYQATELFIQQFEGFFKLPLEEEMKKKTYGYLIASHLFTDLFKQFRCAINGADISNEASRNYPVLSEKIFGFIDALSDVCPLSLLSGKKQLHMRYVLFFSAIGKLTVFEPLIMIHFESDLPDYSELIIKNTIQALFINWFNIQFTGGCSKESDLIIIASSMPKVPNLDFSGKENVYISSTITPDDFLKMNQSLKKINKKKLAE